MVDYHTFLFNCWRNGYKITKIMDKQAIRGNWGTFNKNYTLQQFALMCDNYFKESKIG